ncbi:hypothetical protein KR018_007979 [Drosophila ironensis]|nr:hypothetical protein KR018_007979 [Drosophila ironensis]
MRVRRCRRRLRQRLRLELQNKVPPKNRSIAVETEVVPRKSVAVATKVPQTSCSTSMEARHSTVDEATETKTQKFQTKNVGTEGTRVEHNTVGVGTRTIELETTASQSPHQEWANNQVDTFDLILTFSSEQQTYNAVTQPSSSQTEVLVQSRSTQVEVNAKVAISQTSLNSFSIGNQTERLGIGNAWVQTLVDSQDGMTQTTDDEEDVIKPHLKALYLIHESIRGQSDIIHNGVLEAINQLMDVVLLGMKKSKMEDQISKNSPISVPADPMEEHDSMENLSGSMKNEKPFSSTSLIKPTSKSLYSSGDQVDLIPNSRSGESSSETKDKPSLQYQRGKRIVAGQSWHCSRRCIRCGMYNHLTRTKESVPTK